MNIEIRATNVEVTVALEQHITTKFRGAIGAQRDHLDRVLVRICDVNGPKGGRDIHCHVVARLRGRTLVVHDLAEDAYAATTHAAARLSELMVSVIERHRPSRASLRYVTSVIGPSGR
ncbi:MAG: HPF/RaiA family ribosome-associated protein [Labilithrix sp.]|nr:HPF/RaiA family ribosome-associated protein [Labilithrix sp.]MBX3219851.1 HPF/RaiA family ribosome-associated protein [Labilithrix sp.]